VVTAGRIALARTGARGINRVVAAVIGPNLERPARTREGAREDREAT
jgi:hypothetical protein